MPFFLLHHQHQPHECAAAFAAWQGFDSPLRHGRVPSSCPMTYPTTAFGLDVVFLQIRTENQ
jgi:hypothetical protein